MQLEWFTLVFVRPQGCPPPCQCIAPSILRPFYLRFEADSSDQLFLLVVRILWSLLFGTHISLSVPCTNDFWCLLLVSDFKLGLEPFYVGCASHRNAVNSQTILGLDLRLVKFVFVSVLLCLLSHMINLSLRPLVTVLHLWNVHVCLSPGNCGNSLLHYTWYINTSVKELHL